MLLLCVIDVVSPSSSESASCPLAFSSFCKYLVGYGIPRHHLQVRKPLYLLFFYVQKHMAIVLRPQKIMPFHLFCIIPIKHDPVLRSYQSFRAKGQDARISSDPIQAAYFIWTGDLIETDLNSRINLIDYGGLVKN